MMVDGQEYAWDEARIEQVNCRKSLFQSAKSIMSEVVGCTLRYQD